MQLLIAKQDNRDTAKITEMKKLQFTSYSLAPNVNATKSQTINTVGFETDSWISKIDVSGDTTVEATLGQLEMLIESSGFEKQTQGSTAKKLIYKASNKFDKYLTVVLDDDENESYDQFQGLLVNSLKFETSLESYVNVTPSFIGMNHVAGNTRFSGGATATEFDGKKLICLGASITENGTTDVTRDIESLDITINNSLEGKGALNSVYNKSIKRNGIRDITVNFTYNEFLKENYVGAHTALKANSTYAIKIQFKEVETNNKIIIELPRCKVSNVERTDITGAQGMSKEVSALYDEATGSPIVITIEKA